MIQTRKIVAVLFVFTCETTLHAQKVAVAEQSQNTGSAAIPALERQVALDLTNVTLERAIAEISTQANIRISYAKRALSNAPRVTLRTPSISVDAALKGALKGTNLAVVSFGGQLTLIERSTPQNPPRQTSVITGKVTDAKSGKGIPGATVSIGNDMSGSVTGEDGGYRLTGITPGTHTITIRLLGYTKQVRSIMVGDEVTVTADFKLERSANVLEQVVVTGTVVATELKAIPNAISVITAKQIEERGITRIDQLFRGDIPGLFALNLGSNDSLNAVTMFSRGATALSFKSAGVSNLIGNTNPIKTYIDGVEMANPQYLSQIDPKSIERIEILTGPQASTIYGSNAINGVMQIFTKRGSAQHPSLTLNLLNGWIQNNFSGSLTPQSDYTE